MSRLYDILDAMAPEIEQSGNSGSLQIGNVLLQWGQVSAIADAGTYTDTSETFPTSYSVAPAVFLTTYSASTAAAFASVEICLSGVTASGFTIRAFNEGTTGRSPAVRWLAIGEVA